MTRKKERTRVRPAGQDDKENIPRRRGKKEEKRWRRREIYFYGRDGDSLFFMIVSSSCFLENTRSRVREKEPKRERERCTWRKDKKSELKHDLRAGT